MENSVELRLCRFGAAGLSISRLLFVGFEGGGLDVISVWETPAAAGLGGFCIVASGRSA
jgi:hypothetical protein